MAIGGISLEQAILDQYKPDEGKDEETKAKEREDELKDLVVSTNKRGGMKKIEIVGIDKSYNWRQDISRSRDITLQFRKISELGPSGTLTRLIPNTMNLYLDKNFLHSWD